MTGQARRLASVVLIGLPMLACTEHAGTVLLSPGGTAQTAKSSGGARYKLRFVSGVSPTGDGEMQSAWFPDTGMLIDTKSPWHHLGVSGVILDLVNYTHGSWWQGTCGTFTNSHPINPTNWDIAGSDPLLSFAGSWLGTISVSQTQGTSFGFDGDRVVDGVVTPSAGGIHNVVTNGNAALESRDPTGNNDWFQLELRSAAMAFGSASTADGINNPPGYEVACANFTLVAEKASLIAP